MKCLNNTLNARGHRKENIMEDHERGYTEGYQEALKTIKALLDNGMTLKFIQQCIEEEIVDNDPRD